MRETQLARLGHRLYALSRIAGLSVVDISNPAKLTLLGRYRNISGEPFEMYLRLGAAAGGEAEGKDVVLAMFSSWGSYVADGDKYRFVQTSKLLALDVSNPAQIDELDSFDVPGVISDSRIVGDKLYVVGYEDGRCWRCSANKPQTTVLSLDVGRQSIRGHRLGRGCGFSSTLPGRVGDRGRRRR